MEDAFFGSLEQGVTVSYNKDVDIPIWDVYNDEEEALNNTKKIDLFSFAEHDDRRIDLNSPLIYDIYEEKIQVEEE